MNWDSMVLPKDKTDLSLSHMSDLDLDCDGTEHKSRIRM